MDPREVVAAFDRAVDAGDVAALDAVCHPNMVTHSFKPSRPQGIQGIRDFVNKRPATTGVGGWKEVVEVCDGEYVVQYGTRHVDFPGGEFRGFDVPAGRFLRDSAFMFRVRDGLITDRWAIRDDLAMMVQLGAVSAARPDEVMDGTLTSLQQHPFEDPADRS